MKIVFKSDQFTWKNGRGIAECSDLEINRGPSQFEIVSTRTGEVKTFEFDKNSPGYEDGWDGEYWSYTSNELDERVIKVTILND